MNSAWFWIVLALALISAVLAGFLWIARKGRELRRNQPRPPEATEAFLRWSQDGKSENVQVNPPFYFGKHPDCNVVLPKAKAPYEVCIFYKDRRFAAQVFPDAGEFLINGEDAMATYLRDGDSLLIAGQEFTFSCH
jgi:hypothetical protein